jgi:hypothetical protein
MANAKTYRRRHDDIEAFADALTRFLAVCDPSESSAFLTIYPSWTPKPGREAEAARLAAEVDRASGRAAVALSGEFFIDWTPRGSSHEKRVSPAAMWRTIIDSDPAFPADAIFAVCNQALGVLDMRATEAEEREHSLGGRIERITRLGRHPQSHGHLGKEVIRWLVGLASALVVAYLVYRFGWS